MGSIRDKILAAKQRRREPADAEACRALGLVDGPQLYVAGATARDVDNWLATRSKTKRGPRGQATQEPCLDNTRAKLLVCCLVDAEWRYVFKNSPEDLDALGELPNEVITPLFEQALRLSGLADDDEPEASLKNGQPAAAPCA